jgi:putative endonuclease
VKTGKIGAYGEDLAKTYLDDHGHTIISRNFRWRFGEIDFITKKNRTLHFIEVKYRRSREYGLPQESVIKKKQHKIKRTALLWLQQKHLPMDSEMHFDVLAISKNIQGKIRYEYIEDAF